jgi:AcrR family transcriptional regulator
LFAERGYAGSSLRDLARASGMSLAGLYHHFDSKDKLLYELQRDAYERLMKPLGSIPSDAEPAKKLEALVGNHLRFFAADITAMKVLSHEAEALDGDLGDRIRRLRRKYYSHFLSIVTELLRVLRRKDLNPRAATMTLFGMINWIYTWYKPATDGPPDKLANQMVGIFLNGLDRRTKGQAPAAPRAQSRRRVKREDGQ